MLAKARPAIAGDTDPYKVYHELWEQVRYHDTLVATVTTAVRVIVKSARDSILHINHLVANRNKLSAEMLAFK